MTLILDKRQKFSLIELFSRPFPHFFSPAALTEDSSASILEWLDSCSFWTLTEADFYEQYEFSFWDIEVPEDLAYLKQRTFLESIRRIMELLFNVRLGRRINFAAHKLVVGQRIKLHNDYAPSGETHRLLIQLNHGLSDEDGGLLIFFNGPDPSDIDRIFGPAHNSAIGFAISATSNHAVTPIEVGERFTLVFSFYAEVDPA